MKFLYDGLALKKCAIPMNISSFVSASVFNLSDKFRVTIQPPEKSDVKHYNGVYHFAIHGFQNLANG